jgi:uncharacterized membrane protein YgcG
MADVGYESREPDRRQPRRVKAPLRVPAKTEQLVMVLNLTDAGTTVAAVEMLADAGIPSEVQKVLLNDVPRKSWQPGLRRIMVWSADEEPAKRVIELLQARRHRVERIPRSKGDAGGSGSDHGGFDVGFGDSGGWSD